MFSHRSFLVMVKLGGVMVTLFAVSSSYAQSPTTPTVSADPATIDAIWQKASSKYDKQRAALLKQVDAGELEGPFRADWESLQKYEVPEWYKDAKFGMFIHWGAYSVPAYGNEWYPRNMYLTGSDTPNYTPEDFRFTMKGDALYVIGLAWPTSGEAVIHSLVDMVGSQPIHSVALLDSDAKLQFNLRADGLHVQLPVQPAGKYAYVIRVTFEHSAH